MCLKYQNAFLTGKSNIVLFLSFYEMTVYKPVLCLSITHTEYAPPSRTSTHFTIQTCVIQIVSATTMFFSSGHHYLIKIVKVLFFYYFICTFYMRIRLHHLQRPFIRTVLFL
jgi:hypothetical protein